MYTGTVCDIGSVVKEIVTNCERFNRRNVLGVTFWLPSLSFRAAFSAVSMVYN
jgi:hypothetical protein